MASNGEVTHLLRQWRNGSATAPEELFTLVYAELRTRARGQRRRAWGVHTLNTTSLVHESYLKLIGQTRLNCHDHAHFLAVASTAMRQIVINYAERNKAHKRGGGWQRVTYNEADAQDVSRSESLLAIEQALTQLESIDRRLATIVEYRYFGGLTETEIGRVLNVAPRTVRREWRKAKALLAQALSCQARARNESGIGRPAAVS